MKRRYVWLSRKRSAQRGAAERSQPDVTEGRSGSAEAFTLRSGRYMRVRPLKVAPRTTTNEGVSTSPCRRPLAKITTSREATTSPTTAPRISTVRARIGASTAPVSVTKTLLRALELAAEFALDAERLLDHEAAVHLDAVLDARDVRLAGAGLRLGP